MRLATFTVNQTTTERALRFGAQLDDHIVDLPRAYALMRERANSPAPGEQFPTSVLDFLERSDATRSLLQETLAFATKEKDFLRDSGAAWTSDEVNFLPPIQRPGKIICIGQNYREHVSEMNREMPKYPVLFAKFANTLIGHKQPIVLPRVSEMVDYEAELAVVIGRKCKSMEKEQAFECIAGYTIFNDVSVRDYQRRTSQFLQGKTFDTAGPVGPYLVTADEVIEPWNLDVRLRLNDQEMQRGNTSDFIFDIPTIINYISEVLILEPGDIIATGTPSGVGFARDPQVFLKPGDVVEIEIDNLGVLRNPVVAPK